MTKLWPLLLVALAGCNLADADELLFGSPTGSGVIAIPFDATQSPGCMSWDGTNIDTHPSNPNCDGGGESPVPTQTPWTCGTAYGARGMGTTPDCFLVPTPDGAGGGGATPGAGTPQPVATSSAVPGTADGFARVDHAHVIADGAIGPAKLSAAVPTPQPTMTQVAVKGAANTFTATNTFSGITNLNESYFLTSTVTQGVAWDPATKILQADDGTVRANDVVCTGCIGWSDIGFATPTATATPTPTATVTATPTATVTATAVACGANSYDAVIGPDVGATCVSAVTPVYYATPTPVPTPGSDPALSAKQCNLAQDGIVCEGATADTNELHLALIDPAADRTLSLPNETGTVCTTGSVCTGYMGTSTPLGTSQNSTIHGNDDIDRCYGTDTDWCVRYDETTDDGLRWGANANGAGTTAKPMFGVLGDYDTANGTNITADQVVFGVGKGTRSSPDWVLTVDEDGDVVIDGTLTGDVNAGADTLVMPYTAATPAPTPTAAGNCRWNTYTKSLTCGDGTVAVKLNQFVVGGETTIAAGAATTTRYATLLTTAAQNAGLTESDRQDVAPVDLWCDTLRVRTAPDHGTGEAVTYTVRDDGANTALTCVIDGDAASSACDGASTKECCRADLTTPVLIAQNSLTSLSITCAGANCPSAGLIYWWTLRCWSGSG